jgi:hypothetical protein
MKKPTWVKVIGVLGIIFGCTAILGSLNMMVTPKLFKFQQSIIETALEEARRDPDFPDGMADILRDMYDMPGWFGVWAIVFGAIGVVVGAFYLLAAIWFIQLKRSADKIFIGALGVSILLALLQIITIIPASSIIAVFITAGCTFSLIIDLILLIVIMTSDRSAFKGDAATAGPVQPVA